MEAIAHRRKFRRFDYFEPYPKQQEFFDYGLTKTERLLTAGNQQGKTEAGGFEATCHSTGLYPPDWMGRRWDRPVLGWLCGETGLVVRNTLQKKLFGEPGVADLFGTGLVPKELIIDTSLARGVADLFDTIQVRHVSGGTSILRQKSYEPGRKVFQAEPIDFFWDDEEPAMDIYTEQLARITATQGMGYTTFTSMQGMTALAARFFQEDSRDRAFVRMGLKDALHIPSTEYQKIIDKYPDYEREARVHGGIMRGEGRVFPYNEDILKEPIIDRIPRHWKLLWGVDFGIGHPFAAVLIAVDPDNDVIHVIHAFRMRDALPIMHCAAMRPIGAMVRVAWPQDGTERRDDGKPLADIYKRHGARMLDEWATHADGSVSTWAGVKEMQERMKTGRLKVADHLADWFEEFRNYHVKDGKIVKVADDIMSATRVAVMMRRCAISIPLGGQVVGQRPTAVAEDVDYDLFDYDT